MAGEMREERKVVTALFADVVGSTSSPSGWTPRTPARSSAARFDGWWMPWKRSAARSRILPATKFLALFGAPVAHEDVNGPARRTGAALRIVKRTDDDLGVRAPGRGRDRAGGARADRRAGGIRVRRDRRRAEHCGPPAGARVARTRPRRRRDAPSGRRPVRVGRGAAARAEGQVGAGPGVRGDRRAARCAVRAGTDPDGWPRSRVRTRRDDRRPRARRRRWGTLVVLGDPGIGKSRLVEELRGHVSGSAVAWLEGRCVSFGGRRRTSRSETWSWMPSSSRGVSRSRRRC